MMSVEQALQYYLARANQFWNLYNQAMSDYMKAHPEIDGAPQSGSFPSVGITRFDRHGAGIRIEVKDEIIEFNFIQFYYKNEDFFDIKEIDSYWAMTHHNSCNNSNLISEELWDLAMAQLVEERVLKRMSVNKFVFTKDLLK